MAIIKPNNNTISAITALPAGVGGKVLQIVTANTSSRVTTTSTSFVTASNGLTVNNNVKFGNEILLETENKLKYSISGYFDNLRNSFGESSGNISGTFKLYGIK